MADLQQLQAKRLANWRQTPSTRVPDSAAAAQLIGQVGIATLFPASPEIPNLFHAHAGDPYARPESEWDSPAGQVYGWRWERGRSQAAFYTAIVRNRPTWVSWKLLPALLQVRGDLRTPEQIYQAGELSNDALRIAQALEQTGGVLSTGELRRIAGFPTGKPQRAAYLKAIEELDTRLLLAKVFSEDDLDKRLIQLLIMKPCSFTSLTQSLAKHGFSSSYRMFFRSQNEKTFDTKVLNLWRST